jgi:hypothetical protein
MPADSKVAGAKCDRTLTQDDSLLTRHTHHQNVPNILSLITLGRSITEERMLVAGPSFSPPALYASLQTSTFHASDRNWSHYAYQES